MMATPTNRPASTPVDIRQINATNLANLFQVAPAA